MQCPYCGKEPDCLSSLAFYGKDYGTYVYVCEMCDAYVGTYPGTQKPLGRMANRSLRRWRKDAHSLFDMFWRDSGMTRSEAYSWMAKVMGLRPENAHIALFNEEQCRILIENINACIRHRE